MGIEAPGRTTRRTVLGLPLLALAGGPATRAVAAFREQPWPADKPTPEVALSDLAGRPWRLAAQRGRVVVLNFWATWCEPCRAEMPSLQKLQARHADQGLAIVAVNYKEAAPQIQRFLQAAPFDLPVLLDPEGEAAGAWTPRVFPTTVLVDRTGRARTVVVGGLDWSSADAARLLEPLLAARA